MSDRPLVSVVTGTWMRHDLLMEAIANVREQTYPNIEHVIVHDGPTDSLRPFWMETGPPRGFLPGVTTIRAELGFHASGLFTDSPSVAPFKVAQFLARGEYQMWLADDERMLVPDYIERMVAALDEGADFAYSQVEMWWHGRPEHRWVIGTDPPQAGQITSAFYRRELLQYRMMELHVGSMSDWDQVHHWMQAGATWKFIPEVLFEHRADK